MVHRFIDNLPKELIPTRRRSSHGVVGLYQYKVLLVVFDKLNNPLVLVGKVKLNCNLVVFVDVYISINSPKATGQDFSHSHISRMLSDKGCSFPTPLSDS